MKDIENQWKNIIENGDEIKDIIIEIGYVHTNMRPSIIKIFYTVKKEYTNYRIRKIFTNTIVKTLQN